MRRRELVSPEAEAALVGAALMDPAVFTAFEIIPAHFNNSQLATVWQVGRELAQDGASLTPFDTTAIEAELARRAASVPLSLLLDCQAACTTTAYAGEYARVVRDLAERRAVVDVAQRLVRVSYNGDGTWRSAVAELARQLSAEPAPRELPYTLHAAADALKPLPPTEWVIEELFAAGSVNLVFGVAGCKKTWTLLDAAVCVVLGRPWLNFSTRQGAVLLVDEESGPRRLARRLGDALRGHGAGQETPLKWVSLACFNFHEDGDLSELRRLIDQTGARLVIIDALADVMLGGCENAVKDTQPVFHGLRTVAEATSAAIVVIHHSNKAGGYRGSTAILGAVDLALQVDSKPDSANLDFETIKARDTEPMKFAAAAHFDVGEFHMTPTIAKNKGEVLTKAERYVLRFLEEHGGRATKKDVEGHADVCSPRTATGALYRLADLGKVRRCDDGGQGREAVYERANLS